MAEYTRSFKIKIELDTNKRSENQEFEPYESESSAEFVARVVNGIGGILDNYDLSYEVAAELNKRD